MSGNIGNDYHLLDTPALWVDLDILESNIRNMASFFRSVGVGWRPHTKGIKIPAIAHKLLNAGALGITCAKLSEAEVMTASGIQDILIANQVVDAPKIVRLANLQRHANVMVAVDSLENAADISRAAETYHVRVRVLIEINTGMNRCGLHPGEGAVQFARELATMPGLIFSGVMGWEGHVTKIADQQQKYEEVRRSVGSLTATADLIRKAGFAVEIVSCGGTGDFRMAALQPGITEIQAGGGVFGDLTYTSWGAGQEHSLFVLATVISRPEPARAIINAGHKTMDGEHVMPVVKGREDIVLTKLNAEHGILQLEDATTPLKIKEKLDLIVGYGDFTVFRHDRLYGVRDGKVEVVWDIQGRGKLE